MICIPLTSCTLQPLDLERAPPPQWPCPKISDAIPRVDGSRQLVQLLAHEQWHPGCCTPWITPWIVSCRVSGWRSWAYARGCNGGVWNFQCGRVISDPPKLRAQWFIRTPALGTILLYPYTLLSKISFTSTSLQIIIQCICFFSCNVLLSLSIYYNFHKFNIFYFFV